MRVGIIGLGWVGKAMLQLFPDAEIYSHGIIKHDGEWMEKAYLAWNKDRAKYKRLINKCDIVFICLPTPCPRNKRLNTLAVQKAIRWCKAPLIVIRSTVNPGDTYRWTMVYPNKRGINSKCMPKDVYAWAAWAESNGYKPKITQAILKKNKEWIK